MKKKEGGSGDGARSQRQGKRQQKQSPSFRTHSRGPSPSARLRLGMRQVAPHPVRCLRVLPPPARRPGPAGLPPISRIPRLHFALAPSLRVQFQTPRLGASLLPQFHQHVSRPPLPAPSCSPAQARGLGVLAERLFTKPRRPPPDPLPAAAPWPRRPLQSPASRARSCPGQRPPSAAQGSIPPR